MSLVLPSSSSSLGIDTQLGKPAILHVGTTTDSVEWVAQHRDALRAAAAEHGALLVRGLGLRDAAAAEAVFRRLGTLMVETEAFAPRPRYAPDVYFSSKWPANEVMCMHHELSYGVQFPSLMLFACVSPPTAGGATAVADAATMLDVLPGELVERFRRVGWLLIRNYWREVGVSLSEAFGTDDPAGVEQYCRDNAITFEWRPGGALRTWQCRGAIRHHALSGQDCWFNQIAFLNEWTIDPDVRDYLTSVYGEDGLPFTTRFGDGGLIDADVVQVINDAYAANTMREPWQAGDLMLVDNVRTAHAREPFAGPREVVVGMANAVRRDDVPQMSRIARG